VCYFVKVRLFIHSFILTEVLRFVEITDLTTNEIGQTLGDLRCKLAEISLHTDEKMSTPENYYYSRIEKRESKVAQLEQKRKRKKKRRTERSNASS
jgi:hypothetical protein